MIHNEFEKEEKYKLYRTVREILHPTISKKNISNYKIIIDEEYLPLRVAYPKKVSEIKNIMIFIHGNSKVTECEEKYSEIAGNLAKETDCLLISIDYDEKDNNLNTLYNNIYETIKYLYKSLIRLEIESKKIILVGDSTASSIILGQIDKLKSELKIEKLILLYPILSGEYFGNTKYKSIKDAELSATNVLVRLKEYYKDKIKNKEDEEKLFHLKKEEKIDYPETLVICGNTDPLLDEAKDFALKSSKIKLQTIPFAYHGFLKTKDKEIIREYNNQIKKFIQIE